jgi:hypothetical protein
MVAGILLGCGVVMKTLQHFSKKVGKDAKLMGQDLLNHIKGHISDVGGSLKKAADSLGFMAWAVPLGALSCFMISHGHPRSGILLPVLIGAMQLGLPSKLWSMIHHHFHALPQSAEGFDNVGHVISTIMTFGTIKHTDAKSDFAEIHKRMAKYPHTVKGWSSFTDFFSHTVEAVINSIRERFGYERWVMINSGMSRVDDWCKQVATERHLYQTSQEDRRIVAVRNLVAYHEEGLELEKMFISSRHENVLRRIQAYNRDLSKLCEENRAALQAFRGDRIKPVVLGFVSGPGTGKSYLTGVLAPMVQAASMPLDEAKDLLHNKGLMSQIYTVTGAKHWNGFGNQHTVVWDDFLQCKFGPGDPENDYMRFIRMGCQWPYPLEFADVDSKGKKFFDSKFIILTSNLININTGAAGVITSTEAVARRIDFPYRLCVAPEFALPPRAAPGGIVPNHIEPHDVLLDFSKVTAYQQAHKSFPWHAWYCLPWNPLVDVRDQPLHPRTSLKSVFDSIVARLQDNSTSHSEQSGMAFDLVQRMVQDRSGGVENPTIPDYPRAVEPEIRAAGNPQYQGGPGFKSGGIKVDFIDVESKKTQTEDPYDPEGERLAYKQWLVRFATGELLLTIVF